MPEHVKQATRLYVPDDLAPGGVIILSEGQAHQLRNVLRLASGAAVGLFNGRDGEMLATVEIGKRGATATIVGQTRPQDGTADPWLVFAPIKPDRMAIMIEKATELGVARLLAAITARTQGSRLRTDKLAETAREAAEQCERLSVPIIDEPKPLKALLDDWPLERRLFLCAESGEARPSLAAFQEWHGPAAMLIGPEGGLTEHEFETLRAHPAIVPITLGPLILRAETAAIAALAVWNAR